jgi:hypothetical protein
MAMKTYELLRKNHQTNSSDPDFFTHLEKAANQIKDTFIHNINQTKIALTKATKDITKKVIPFFSKVGNFLKKPLVAIFNWFKGIIKISVIIIASIIFLCICIKSLPCICQCIINNIILKICSHITAFLIRKAERTDKNVIETWDETDQNADQNKLVKKPRRKSRLQTIVDFNNNQLDLLLEETERIPTPPLQIISPITSNTRFKFTDLITTQANIIPTMTISTTSGSSNDSMEPPPPPPLPPPLEVKTPTFQPNRDSMILPPPPLLTCSSALQNGQETEINEFDKELTAKLAKRRAKNMSLTTNILSTSPKPLTRLEQLREHNSNSVPSKLHIISQIKLKSNIKQPNTDTNSYKSVKFQDLIESEL